VDDAIAAKNSIICCGLLVPVVNTTVVPFFLGTYFFFFFLLSCRLLNVRLDCLFDVVEFVAQAVFPSAAVILGDGAE